MERFYSDFQYIFYNFQIKLRNTNIVLLLLKEFKVLFYLITSKMVIEGMCFMDDQNRKEVYKSFSIADCNVYLI